MQMKDSFVGLEGLSTGLHFIENDHDWIRDWISSGWMSLSKGVGTGRPEADVVSVTSWLKGWTQRVGDATVGVGSSRNDS